MNKEQLIEKLQKLKAMADGSANENEAMIAMRKLHKLLAEYNISIEEIEDKANIGEEGVKVRNRPWSRIIAKCIAELYFCDMYFYKLDNNNAMYMFIGSEANRTFAKYIFELAKKTVERESRVKSRELYGKEVCSFVNSFWTGASDRIYERCHEMIEAAKVGELQDEDGNNLPMLADVYSRNKLIIQDYKDENMNLKKVPNKTKVQNDLGLKEGRITGGRVQLNRTLQKNSIKMIGA